MINAWAYTSSKHCMLLIIFNFRLFRSIHLLSIMSAHYTYVHEFLSIYCSQFTVYIPVRLVFWKHLRFCRSTVRIRCSISYGIRTPFCQRIFHCTRTLAYCIEQQLRICEKVHWYSERAKRMLNFRSKRICDTEHIGNSTTSADNTDRVTLLCIYCLKEMYIAALVSSIKWIILPIWGVRSWL